VNYAVISVGERTARYGDIKVGDNIILQEFPDGRIQKPRLEQMQ
jgi:hypothetical protein